MSGIGFIRNGIERCKTELSERTCCEKSPCSFFSENCGKHMCSTLSMMMGGTDVAVLSIMLYRSRMAKIITAASYSFIVDPPIAITKGLPKLIKTWEKTG